MSAIKLTVHSDGVDGVIVSEDGQKLANVRDVRISMGPRELTVIDLEIVATPVNVTGAAGSVTLTCPLCDHSDSHDCGREQ